MTPRKIAKRLSQHQNLRIKPLPDIFVSREFRGVADMNPIKKRNLRNPGEIMTLTKDFQHLGVIGEGSFARVHLRLFHVTGL